MNNIAHLKTFLSFLDNHKDAYFSVAYLDENSLSALSQFGSRYQKQEQILLTLEELKGVRPTLHVTLNKCNDKGRRTENVVGVRVLCLDLDTPREASEIENLWSTFKPHLLIQSSPEKYHVYWKISPELPTDVWKKFQLALAWKFKGDLSLDALAKTIRAPGVRRLTKEGLEFIPEIVGEAHHGELSYQDLIVLFPDVLELYDAACSWRETERTRLRAELKKFKKDLKSGSQGVIDTTGTGRNNALWNELFSFVLEASKDGIEINESGDLSGSYSKGVTYEELYVKALEINAAFKEGPLSESEVQKIVKSALSIGMEKVEEGKQKKVEVAKELLEELKDLAEHPTNGFPGVYEYSYDDWKNFGALAEGRFTTMGCVDRVMQRYGENIVKVGQVIYAFDSESKVWRNQKPHFDLISDFSRVCARDCFRDPEFPAYCSNSNGELSPSLLKSAKNQFMGSTFVKGVASFVTCNSKIRRLESHEFDSDKWKFYLDNGLLDLRTGELREATPHDYLFCRSKVPFVLGAPAPEWEKFIEEVFSENDEPKKMGKFLQDVFGYCLTGSIDAQKIFVHYGSGSNGKSKVLYALGLLMGGYGTCLVGSTLAKNDRAFQGEMARMGAKIEGKRVVTVDDLDTKTQWNEGIVKNMTSPFIMTRKLYEEERDIPNRAKFHIGCNERPTTESENFGILRRLCIIPYLQQFDPNVEKEVELLEMIHREAPGILNWALTGLKRFLTRGGFEYPREVLASVEEYRAENFTGEVLLEKLFKVQGTKVNEAWHELGDLVEVANRHLEKHGMENKKVNTQTLGSILKSTFKVPMKRMVVKGEKKRFYLLKIAPEISNSEMLDKLE